MAVDLFHLANIAKLEGNLEDARKTFSEALVLLREADDAVMITLVEQGLAEVADQENQRAEAKRQVNELLSSLHEHKDPSNEIGAESLLANIALEEGDTAAAAQAIVSARSLLRSEPGLGGTFCVCHRQCPLAGGDGQIRRSPRVA